MRLILLLEVAFDPKKVMRGAVVETANEDFKGNIYQRKIAASRVISSTKDMKNTSSSFNESVTNVTNDSNHGMSEAIIPLVNFVS